MVSGLAGEFIQYFTTPEEYDRQHYEGGSTLYGPLSSNLLRQELAELARRLVRGEPRSGRLSARSHERRDAERRRRTARAPRRGRSWSSHGARAALRTGRVRLARRAARASTARSAAPSSRSQRRAGRRWRTVDSDLGLGMLWKVDGEGAYRAPLGGPAERRDRALPASGAREALPARVARLPRAAVPAGRGPEVAAGAGRVAVSLDYPAAVRDVDLRHRPASARGGVVRFLVGGRTVAVRGRGSVFEVPRPPGASVSVPAGAARDRHGNRNGKAPAALP